MVPNVPITSVGFATFPFAVTWRGGHALAHWSAHVLLFVGSDESV
jgi:hypothetical protein